MGEAKYDKMRLAVCFFCVATGGGGEGGEIGGGGEGGSGSSRRRSINGRTKGGGGERRREKEVGTRKNAANAPRKEEEKKRGVGCCESHRAQNVVIRQTRKSCTPPHPSASICGSSTPLRGPCVLTELPESPGAGPVVTEPASERASGCR